MSATALPEFVRLVGHPLRWHLVTALARSDLRVRELVAVAGEPQNLVSYHLRLLRAGGLVTSRRSSFDGRDTYYHLDLERCAGALADVGVALHPALRMTPVPEAPQAWPNVLFVCSGNSARSPIAEALLRRHVGGHVSSAGTRPKDRIHPHAVRVLREHYDIDIAGQAPRAVDSTRHDQVITLCDKAREVIHTPIHWSIPDPVAVGNGQYPAFVEVAADIDTRVRHLLPSLSLTEKEK